MAAEVRAAGIPLMVEVKARAHKQDRRPTFIHLNHARMDFWNYQRGMQCSCCHHLFIGDNIIRVKGAKRPPMVHTIWAVNRVIHRACSLNKPEVFTS